MTTTSQPQHSAVIYSLKIGLRVTGSQTGHEPGFDEHANSSAQHSGLFPKGFNPAIRAGLLLQEVREVAPSVRMRLEEIFDELQSVQLITSAETKTFSRTAEKCSDSVKYDSITDALRYGVIAPNDKLSEAFKSYANAIGPSGFLEFRRSNHWVRQPKPGLNLGINSLLKDLDTGFRFQVRFFTPQHWEAIDKAHKYYEDIRSGKLSPREIAEARQLERDCFKDLDRPPGVDEIASFESTLAPVTSFSASPL